MTVTAIEIKTPEIYEIVKNIDPTWDLAYEDVRLNFLVLGFPGPGENCLMTPQTIAEHFDHIENGPQIILKHLVK